MIRPWSVRPSDHPTPILGCACSWLCVQSGQPTSTQQIPYLHFSSPLNAEAGSVQGQAATPHCNGVSLTQAHHFNSKQRFPYHHISSLLDAEAG
eukprot:336174-Pelagomonas_calceolata.AAC.1